MPLRNSGDALLSAGALAQGRHVPEHVVAGVFCASRTRGSRIHLLFGSRALVSPKLVQIVKHLRAAPTVEYVDPPSARPTHEHRLVAVGALTRRSVGR